MTISTTASEKDYATDGVSTSFAIPFPFETAADLKVTLTDAAGNVTPVISGYSTTGGNGSTGTLNFNTAPANGLTLWIFDNPELKQQIDYVSNDAFPAETNERGLDRLTRMVKRLSQRINRSLRTADGDPITDLTLGSVDNRKGKFLFFNVVTGAIEYALSLGTTIISQSIIGELLFPQSAEESVAGLTSADLNKWRDYDDIRRYKVVADGTDQYAKILKAMNVLSAAGGGKMRFPLMGTGVIGITETIQPYDNVTLEFEGTFLKLLSDTTYDSAITPQPGARNVTLINPLIDCNNIPAGCGIIARRNNTDMTVIGGTVKNAAHHTTDKGGRALNVEAGVDPTLEGPRNLRVAGLLAKNCYEACSISGGDTASFQNESNIRIDMLAEHCESLLSLFGNTSNYPHDSKEMGCHITITGRNCGKAVTYSRVHGVVNSDRGCNAVIDVHCENDSTYGTVGSFWRGDASNIKFAGKLTGQCTRALLDFASYQEVNAIDEDATYTSSGNTLSTLDSDFDVKHSGTAADVFNLPIVSAAFLKNCRFKVATDIVTTGKPGNTNTVNKTDCWAWIQNKTQNAVVAGYLADIDAMTFAQAANLEFNASKQAPKCWGIFVGATGALNRGFNASVSRVSTGVYDVTFSVKPPGGGTSYVIIPASQASAASNQVDDYSNITNAGFRITTYSGGAVADKALAGFVVLW